MKWAKSKDEIVVFDSGGSCIFAMKYIDEHRYYCCSSADYNMGLCDDTSEVLECTHVLSETWSPDERTPEEQTMYELLNKAIDDFIGSRPKRHRITIKEPVIDVYYTGGGIWLASAFISKNIYVTYSDECPECLAFYDKSQEDDYETYPCMEMIDCKEMYQMSASEKKLYKQIKEKLEKETW